MSLKVQFDSNGFPALGYIEGGATVFSAAAIENKGNVVKADSVSPNKEEEQGASRWVNWGTGNDFPIQVYKDIKQNGIASRALKLKVDMLYGKRLIPCRVKGFDPNGGKEIVEFVDDPNINEFLKRSNVDQLRNRLIHDFVFLGQCFPILHLNADRSKIAMVDHDKGGKFRYAPFDKSKRRIDEVFRSANWPTPSEDQLDVFKCLDSFHYYLEIDRVRYEDEMRYVFPVRTYDIVNDYYSIAIWNTVRENGWLANSNSIPKIIQSIIKNSMTIKYHIRIPLSYWKGQFDNWERMKPEDRTQVINAKLQEINDFLTGVDNPMKSFISHYATDPQTGKEVAGWQIDALEDKMKYDAWNSVSTAASAEIMFAIGINPAIFGLGNPGGELKSGGSDIRESWLTMIASAQGERDTIYSWWPFVREYNGYPSDVELRTVDQVLTTLDQGKGTAKTLS
ncbi:hypothetical protein [Pedobacter gandavensis]|uniref:Phage portal protein n=1 Tax=Pedobacter gandavensis TaxID=2679963 RepID=A0ABR6EVY0_9SPHI|nr:hypothetical protein [Pedobacter gandavensis]MBB2149172.1 hypothetical protein [Pedobacter gandavensis]